MPAPCYDCGEPVRIGPPSPVYQPSPPPVPQTREVCVLLPDTSTTKGVLTQFWVQVPSSDCPTNVCMQPCGNSILTDLAGNDLAGQVIDCDVASTTPPQVPGVEVVCADASGTWTSPACATQIRINVTQADATGPVLTIGVQNQILQTGLYEWNAPPGAVIDSMTLTNNSLNQCSEITWLQSGTVATPEQWVLSTNTAGTRAILLDANTIKTDVSQPVVFGGNLYIPTNIGIRRYDNAGMSWTTPLAGRIGGLCVDTGGTTLYATVGTNEVYSSSDGVTWNLHSTIAGETRIGGIVELGGDLYSYSSNVSFASTAGAIYRYTGAAWGDISAGSDFGNRHVFCMEKFDNDIYVGVYRSSPTPQDNKITHYDPDTGNWIEETLLTNLERFYGIALRAHNGDLFFSAQFDDTGGAPSEFWKKSGGVWSKSETGTIANTKISLFSDGVKLLASAGYNSSNGNIYEYDTGTDTFSIVPNIVSGQASIENIAYLNSTYWALGGTNGGANDIRYYQPAIAGNCG